MELVSGLARELWATLCQMAPYLLFGFFVAGLLSTVVSPALVRRHLGGRGFMPVFKAALLGVPLPLCSCGVIPVAMSLRRQGARRGPVVAFLLSTPQTGVDSILVTLSLLGPVVAVFRPVAAFVTGLVGGLVENLLGERDEVPAPGAGTAAEAETGPAAGAGPARRIVAAMRYGFMELPADIGRAVFAGLVVAALISYFVPKDFFSGMLGNGIFAMLMMMVVAIPMYVCATASVPIAAAMIAKGLSPGAALVFLIAGPGTNAAGIAAIWHVMGRRSALLYLATVIVCSLAAGLLLDRAFSVSGAGHVRASHAMLPAWLETASAVALLAVLGTALAPRRRTTPVKTDEAGAAVELVIEGMTCAHCAQTVQKALLSVPGVRSASVSLATRKAVVSGDFDRKALADAVRSAGYEVKDGN